METIDSIACRFEIHLLLEEDDDNSMIKLWFDMKDRERILLLWLIVESHWNDIAFGKQTV